MPTERSRSRRERRSESVRRPVLHVVMPGLEVAREVPKKGETVTAFLRRTGWAWKDRQYGWQFKKGLPTVLEVNGEPLLRRHWSRRRIAANDNLRFVSHPLGGQGGPSGKQIIGLVALIALTAFSGGIAGAILGPTLANTALLGSLTFGQALAGGIVLGGALLINALTAPKPGATNTPGSTQDQIYTVQAQGNIAKLGQPLPVRYGREKVFPDFAATPWGEFVGNDQYLNILLSWGMGTADYEQMYISDTPFWNPTDGVSAAFSSAQIAFYAPGETVTLFPVNVSQSDEVTGQQLPHGTPGDWIGPFVANPSATDTYQLAIDFVFPAGCFTTDDNGNTIAYSVELQAEIQEVDDAGAPIGDPVTQSPISRTYSSRSPIRDTYLIPVTDGRYQVKFRRNSAVPEDTKGAADVVWAGLRAYLRGSSAFADVSTIAIRIKATESTQGSYKFGVLGTRKLPVWNGSAFVTQATRNPFWAFLDSVTNTQYGSRHPVSKTDFNAIFNAAVAADERGDHFDYSFVTAMAVPDAWDKILTVARSRHCWLGDTVSVVRDEWSDVPSLMLTDREIVRDSMNVTFTMLGPDDPDAVSIEYIDENTWLPAQVQYPPESVLFTAINPETKRLDGILNRSHAFRECAFYYLQSIYRRENVSIGSEYEGRAITFGQTLRIQSELPQNYGFGGAVEENAAGTLTLNPAPTWDEDNQNFIRLRRPNGKWFGPVNVAKGDDDGHAVLNPTDLATVESQQGITLANALLREDGGEYPSFEFGTAENQSRVVKVLSGQPSGDHCTLNLVVDDERVHTTDLGDPPVLPVGQFPANSQTPLIAGLNAQWVSDVLEPKLGASWFPAAGALYYRADVSYDQGESWIQVYEGVDNKFTTVVARSALTLRVQAVGVLPGPYSTVDLEAPTIKLGDDIVSYNSLNDAIKALVTSTVDDNFEEVRKAIAKIANVASQALSRTSINKQIVRTDIVAVDDRATASISQVATVAADAQSAVAELQNTVGAQFDDLVATVTETSTAVATLEGYAGASWSVAVDVNGNVVGLVLVNDTNNISSFTVTADKFQVAFPGHAGGTAVPVFTIANVGGVAKLALRGDMIIDGSIITQMIQAGAITAVKIQSGSINTTQLAINGVDILNIVKGAATQRTTLDFSVTPGSGNTIGGSQNVNIVSGAATCIFSGALSSIDASSHAVANNIVLYVDGVARSPGMSFSGSFSSSWQWTVTGLSAGSHTFDWRIFSDGFNTFGTIIGGQTVVIDLRR